MTEEENPTEQVGNKRQEDISAEEVFKGKEVVLGEEIVELLAAEEIGVPIYRINPESKSQLLVNREIGEEDVSVTQRDVTKHILLGIVIKTEEDNKFIFLGIQETGGIFVIDKDAEYLSRKFDPKHNTSQYYGGKFWDKMNEVHMYNYNVVLREEENQSEFNQVATAAVLRARDEKTRIRKELAESRRNLKTALFGKSSEKS